MAFLALALGVLFGWCLRGSQQAGSLVGPGAVGSYQGPSQGRRHGGFVRVQDPSVGFFVAGSTIRELNGLYGRVQQPTDLALAREFQLAYRHDLTGWYLALAASTEEDRELSGKGTVWLFIDNNGIIRLRHDGDTLIPGSGTRWSHVRQKPQGAAGQAEGGRELAAAAAAGDDLEELPWQLVGVGVEGLLAKLRSYFNFYKHTVQQAIAGDDLPPLPSVPWMGDAAQAPPLGLQVPLALPRDHADWPCQEGELLGALQEALDAARGKRDHWVVAVLNLQVAACHRCRRAFREADESRASALAAFPRYKDALMERGLGLLDEGKYAEAIVGLETLLHLDRSFPSLDAWLVRAHALDRREKDVDERAWQAMEGQATKHCVAWRQTGACNPSGAREPHRDRGCSASVESGLSGWCECKGTLGAAGESTCAHEAFTCADKCFHKWDALDGTAKDESLAEALRSNVEVDPCSPHSGGPADWCSPDHYRVLGVRCDLPWPGESSNSEELKRAYKKRSLQLHPDKRGGSVWAFQRVAAAHEVLSDPAKRRAFDGGEDLRREPQEDGTEGPSHKMHIEKKYFPERFDFEPFGDPRADRKEREATERRYLERRRQDALAQGERAEL